MRSRSKLRPLESIKNIFLFLGFFTVVGCSNVLREVGNRSSDEFLIFQTKQYLSEQNWDLAASTIAPVKITQPTNEEVFYLSASAYAGRAGLRVLDLLTTIASDGGTKSLFTIFAEHYPGADEDTIADIESATAVIEAFSATAAGRSSEMNLFAVFVFYSRIGAALATYAFNSEGVVRENFTACHTVDDFEGVMTGLPDDMVDNISTSIPRVVDALSGVTVEGGAIDAIRDVSLPDSLTTTPLPCSSDPTNVNCLLTRNLVNLGPLSGGIGLGTGGQFAGGGICLVLTP